MLSVTDASCSKRQQTRFPGVELIFYTALQCTPLDWQGFQCKMDANSVGYALLPSPCCWHKPRLKSSSPVWFSPHRTPINFKQINTTFPPTDEWILYKVDKRIWSEKRQAVFSFCACIWFTACVSLQLRGFGPHSPKLCSSLWLFTQKQYSTSKSAQCRFSI